METRWMEGTVGNNGELLLENLPFKPGQVVEVLVISRVTPAASAIDKPLRGSVLEYREPFEPAGADDWEALQ